MEKKQSPSRLRRGLSAVLAVLMLAGCAFMCAMTLVPNRKNLLHALTYRSKLQAYLPEDGEPNALELFAARVRSLDAEVSASVYRSEELGQLNATVQYALGKRLVSTGSAQMVRLNGGWLYDLQEEQSLESAAEEILDLQKTLPDGLPFLFVYEHPTVYDAAMLPAGYEVLDYGEEAADEVTSILRAGGIRVIDSRDVLTGSGYPLESFLLRTDQHWSTFAALVMSREIAVWTQTEAGLPVDPSLLDVENFASEVYPRLFLGRYGQRIGAFNVEPDDMTLFWPKYDTDLSRHTVRKAYTTDTSGDFKSAVVRWDSLERNEDGWNTTAYKDYGLSDIEEHFHNPNAPEGTILLFKDSYSSPVGAFLALTVRDVYTVDLRQTDRPALAYVEDYQPDALIMAYSQQMLRNREYVFVD